MKALIKSAIKGFLINFDLELSRVSTTKDLHQTIRNLEEKTTFMDERCLFLSSLSKLSSELLQEPHCDISEISAESTSQIAQDLFVLSRLNYKTNGFFVEFGATDGRRLSNTHLLEKRFGWKGLLAEPCRRWQKDLAKNRNCHIDSRCVWVRSGDRLQFTEADEAELSTIADFNDTDHHSQTRSAGISYEVETVSLNDLLSSANAPSQIDYLSIDTEGSELEILRETDFNKWHFSVITCEHNYTEKRQGIFDLLTANGFVRVFESISDFDDWYVHSSLIKGQARH
ncbi:FkbM family methyltransferase [Haloferula sp. BvORR071]|uniref:FkbM family methyltransferase n=1 Tax=Haloferula sp. BvORR071 TaxID=1396141 RepID=UPI0005546FE9|nr:FkbM family methyltransferase [Haloferula sp. BvORR071]